MENQNLLGILNVCAYVFSWGLGDIGEVWLTWLWELVKHTLRKMVTSWNCEACGASFLSGQQEILSKGMQLKV